MTANATQQHPATLPLEQADGTTTSQPTKSPNNGDQVAGYKPASGQVAGYLQQAVAHHQAGRLQDAERLYRAILQAQPNHPDANHNLGVLAVQVRQPAAGLPLFKAALETNPAQVQYWLSYIDALIQAGQTVSARQVLEQGRQRGLQGVAVEVLAGRLAGGAQAADVALQQDGGKESQSAVQINGQLDDFQKRVVPKSLKSAKSVSKLDPRNEASRVPSLQEMNALAVLFGQGRYGETECLAQAMIARFPLHGFGWKVLGAVFMQQGRIAEALLPMQKAVGLLPKDADAHSNLGIVLEGHGLFSEAEASYRRALQIKQDYPEPYCYLGTLLKGQGRYSEAEACYRRALAIKPEFLAAYNNLGLLLKEQNRLPDAEESFRKALAINPDYPEAHNNLGLIFRELNQFADAVDSFRRALAIKPDFAEVHNNLGITFKEQGRLIEAEACYRQALEIKPEYAEACNNLGLTLREQGRLVEAETCCRQALEMKPDFADAHCNLGGILKELDRLTEAVVCCRQALEIKPDLPEAYINLGAALNEQGELEQAIVAFEQAIRYKPSMASAYKGLGDAFRFMDRAEDELRAYQKALDIDPGNVCLDTEVWLALRYYLNGDFEQFRGMLQADERVMATADDKYKSSRVYREYLVRLLSWHQQPAVRELQPKDMETLYVIGESHSLSAHGAVARYRGREMRCAAQWIGGCKQWHLGNSKANNYKCKFEAIMARLPRQSPILLTIGEIDCRPDEGIIKAWKKSPDKSLDEIAQDTAGAYVRYVAGIAASYGHQMIVGGVPATNIPPDMLMADATVQLVRLIRAFNATLKDQALAAGMDFLDVYTLTDRGDGMSSGKWHMDNFHLLPSAITEAFGDHCISAR